MIYLVSALLVAYLYLLYNKQKSLKESLQKEKMEYLEAEQLLLDDVEEILGRDDAERLREEKIWRGMPKCLIYFSWGKPHEIKKNVSASDTYEYWYFGPKPYKYGGEIRYKYKTQVDIRNSFITGWKDL